MVDSFSQHVKSLFPHSLVIVRGTVSNHTVIHKDDIVTNISMRSDASSSELTISFKNELPTGIYGRR